MSDTNTDAVKALARDHQTVGDDPDKYVTGHPHHWKTAQVLMALLAERDALRAKLDEVVEAAEKMIAARNKYEATPTDRGGAWGTKGRANNDWRITFAELDATIAKIKGADHE